MIGYPGLVDNSELVSSTQVLSSTVTEGSVSAIKPNSNNTFELIQIDAAVQNGNSGGPIVNEDGCAVGIATYKLSSDSGNYNFGISAKELLSFLETASIQPQSNSMRESLENSLQICLLHTTKELITTYKLCLFHNLHLQQPFSL